MLYFIPTPMIILYLAAFKINTLNPYRMVLLLTVMTLAIGIPITDLLKLHYSVPRPWILYPDITHIYPVRGSCFPSGHAFQAFAGIIPLTLCLLKQKTFKKTVTAILLLIFAITLSFSRILAGMHFPSDILFAIGLATLLIPILASLLQWLIKTGKLNTQNEKWYSIIFTILITIAIIYL
jgi:undecaprenyl-diphosphatase